MAGVALNGSTIKLSTKNDYVKFSYEWSERHSDGDGGKETRWYTGHGSTDADVEGVVSSDNKIFINNVPIATVGDKTSEHWVANPTPSAPRGSIKSVSPGKSGSGEGEVSGGSAKVFYNGKAVAMIGSPVKTMLDTDTTIETGNDKINISS
ncbi:hypothetical protein G9G63_09955 [Paenibacillus sp. EKM202P]|uniref:hypothetical protein n=1 Tax=unclassified Paenibacillus TaxID=185978 RepID=UPI0013EAEF32|nr:MULTISPECIES: hypothetical protein [unclassified Paenibacillus]KAF6565471.1 hypothetical protein G9G63_09955 [Paenibacillus sp. EKM202P]KAF6569204.1 hypothetical protein G9G64_12140 [Paenibacillus sp. EKM207P]